ncbi:CHAT domain-containing protein [Rhodococcus sp. B50]|uniref:CHAT domain-containing protein n=1 Tax=Rhodococcus sp. B50 TaxID=2682847 RepID=UPI001BD2A798|nr:CHAT domain-containing protein [Rhodococcus sp. B50]MBS9375357.1 hypothetical protein [Rhodococcus sp. B50]
MRTVVGLSQVGNGAVVTLEQSPNDVPDDGRCDPVELPGLLSNNPRERGATLMTLLESHRPVAEALRMALAQPAEGPPRPLYLRVRTPEIDALPWEELYSAAHGFCALDHRWPVGRIVNRWINLSDRTFTSSLRVVALLSAAGRSGVPQLDSLVKALRSPDARNVGLSVHVITGDPSVLDAAEHVHEPAFTCEEMTTAGTTVARQIAAHRPDIVHVLCHGKAVGGVHSLLLATPADFLGGEETGLVSLTASDLVRELAACNPWLIVLVACESAGVGEGPALAQDLTARNIPAVIGMRRLLDISEADSFCSALYPELLRVIRDSLNSSGNGRVHTIDWVTALTVPRRVLSGADPEGMGTWSDPVLYAQAEQLRIYHAEPAASEARIGELVTAKEELTTWREFRNLMEASDAPEELLDKVNSTVRRLERTLEALQ